MIIVGLTGSIGCGKTTLADFLAEQVEYSGHYESWQLIAEVADELRNQPNGHPDASDKEAINKWLEPLPAILETICHKKVGFDVVKLTKERMEDPANYDKLFQYLADAKDRTDLQTAKITEANKEALRSILQWLGGYLAKQCGGEIWYAEIIRRIQAEPGLELATIGGVRFPADAKCIKEANGCIAAIVRPGWEERDKKDLTERERDLINPDTTILNNGSLEELHKLSETILDDLKSGRLQKRYQASYKA